MCYRIHRECSECHQYPVEIILGQIDAGIPAPIPYRRDSHTNTQVYNAPRTLSPTHIPGHPFTLLETIALSPTAFLPHYLLAYIYYMLPPTYLQPTCQYLSAHCLTLSNSPLLTYSPHITYLYLCNMLSKHSEIAYTPRKQWKYIKTRPRPQTSSGEPSVKSLLEHLIALTYIHLLYSPHRLPAWATRYA